MQIPLGATRNVESWCSCDRDDGPSLPWAAGTKAHDLRRQRRKVLRDDPEPPVRGAGRDGLPPRMAAFPWKGRSARQVHPKKGRGTSPKPLGNSDGKRRLSRVSQDRKRAFGPGCEHRYILCSAQWGLAAMPAPISIWPLRGERPAAGPRRSQPQCADAFLRLVRGLRRRPAPRDSRRLARPADIFREAP